MLYPEPLTLTLDIEDTADMLDITNADVFDVVQCGRVLIRTTSCSITVTASQTGKKKMNK